MRINQVRRRILRNRVACAAIRWRLPITERSDLTRLGGVLPKVPCFEFDQPETRWRVVWRVRALLDAGFVLHKADGCNFTFSFSPGA